jgi:hypothetical protein
MNRSIVTECATFPPQHHASQNKIFPQREASAESRKIARRRPGYTRLSYVCGRVRLRRGSHVKVKWNSPVTAGAIGFACLLSSVIWSWSYSSALHRDEQQTGWILDRTPPKGIGILAAYGVGLILAALVWACVRMISRRLALRKKNRARISARSASS